MGRLIDDLLMFSRLGRMSMQTVPVDMTSLAAEVFDELSSAQDRTPDHVSRRYALPTAEATARCCGRCGSTCSRTP
jgi:light-regulated signal transduction histidine kinase (bacteriophytochrome)